MGQSASAMRGRGRRGIRVSESDRGMRQKPGIVTVRNLNQGGLIR